MVSIKNMILKNKKGFSTIYAILILSVFIPTALFVSVDVPYMITMNRKIKNTLDNATSTAVTCINEQMASQGTISISQTEAEYWAKKIISESFGLNDDLTVNKNSLLEESPKVTVTVINDAKSQPTYETANGTFKISNPSVVVYAEVPVQCKFLFMAKPVIKQTSISQAQFK